MKGIAIKILVFILLGVGSAQVLQAQQHAILSYFNAEVGNNSVLLKWAVSGGNTCNGIRVYHSTDDLHYEQVEDIPGVCGDAAVDIGYQFLHDSILLQGTHYYKLELGNQGFSSPLSVVFYQTNGAGYKMYPNPGRNGLYIFSNHTEGESLIQVISIQGSIVYENTLREGQLNYLNLSSLEKGMYIVKIVNDKGSIQTFNWIKL